MKSKILNKIIKTSIYLRKAKYFQLLGVRETVQGSKSREGLTQARQLRVDDTVRKAAEIKHDKRILALASRELVAAEAQWHHSCYKNYTRTNSKSENTTDTEELPDSYTEAEFNAFSRLCDYIRNELFQRNTIIALAPLIAMLPSQNKKKKKKKKKNDISKQHSKQAIRQEKLRKITKCLLTRFS